MTTSKQDHIISTLPPLFQFIKDTYLIVKNHITDLPVQEFYRVRQHHEFTAYPGGPYKKFLTKKWIHETDEINIEGIDVETPEKPTSDPNALVKFLANIYNPASKSQVDQEEVEPVVEKPAEEKPAPVLKKPTEEKPVSKKTPPPVPLKPDCLKVKPAPVINEDPIPEESPAPIESDTDEPIDSFWTSPAEFSASVTALDPEPAPEEQPIPEPDTELEVDWDPEPKEGTRAHWAWHERHRWDRKPWVKNSKDQVFNDLYNTGKDLWAKYQDVSDDYDWEILAFEVEECPTTRIEDEYQYYLREVVDRFKDWIEYNGNLPKTPSRKELADLIRIYKEDRDAEIIPTTSGYETMKMNKGKAREIPEECPKTDMERQWGGC
ncbi:uncharacterized protein OCT59_009964 [Rhizophagus irregularis]|uniref:uncharacterized protein n=1 Tax=Rhizophagus irregularis TaxID=588596 RepID=UPI003316E7FC|nr:hypothetical protein OCT59_009964 [Rhizophagus irregularis]